MKAELGATAFLAVIDVLWITSNLPMYKRLVAAVQQGRPMRMRMPWALCAYAIMFVALWMIVLPAVKAELLASPNAARSSFWSKVPVALRHGALFGFVAYGIYNATNLAIFDKYPVSTAVVDTLWGTTAYFAATLVYCWLAG